MKRHTGRFGGMRIVDWRLWVVGIGVAFVMLAACSLPWDSSSSGRGGGGQASLRLEFERVESGGLDPFTVTAFLNVDGSPAAGKTIDVNVPRGSVSGTSDNGDGSYEFTVTPSSTGVYPVTVSYGGASVRRDALVLSELLAGVGQPLLVPGMVNTDGYEDGITITPDGEYLFVQYGPLYFSGVLLHSTICAEAGWTLYNLDTCPGKPDSSWVFGTRGPYSAPLRPGFPTGAIVNGTLSHIDLLIPGDANGIVLFPTVFYGFKRQADGSFAEPFKLAFNDSKGTNGPFGLSFQMTGPDTAEFVVAWNNYFDGLPGVDVADGANDKPDIYLGSITMGQNTSLGDVSYVGGFFSSIDPAITPVGLASHDGVQGNPHLYYDSSGAVKSIWVDDEQVGHDITVYVLTAGSFPDGTWAPITLPAKINPYTPGDDEALRTSQPFFDGSRLFLNRGTRIVYHEYNGTHDSTGYADSANWGEEVVALASTDGAAIGGIFGVGEPTLAQRDGTTWLYFAYVETRAAGTGAGRYDFKVGAAFVDIPSVPSGM